MMQNLTNIAWVILTGAFYGSIIWFVTVSLLAALVRRLKRGENHERYE